MNDRDLSLVQGECFGYPPEMRVLDAIARADTAVQQQVQPLRSRTWLGATTVMASVAGEALLVALAAHRLHRAALTHRQAAAVAAVVLVERAGTTIAKQRIGRQRPPQRRRPRVALHPTSASFPSRHASFGFFCATVLELGHRRAALYAVAALVAGCRLHQGVHAPSDLAAGAGIGIAAGSAANRAISRLSAANEMSSGYSA